MKRYCFYLFILLFLPLVPLKAQDAPILQASAPKVVSTGSSFQVVYTANGEIQGLQAPAFGSVGFNLIMGPNYNTEFYMSMNANGQMQQSRSISVSFFLVPTAEGVFTIPAASCKINGQTVKSNPLTIKVEKGKAPTSQMPQTTQAPNSPRSAEAPAPTELNDQTIFLRVVPSKTKALKGEQIILTYKLYTQVQVPRYQVTKLPSNKGFWLEELDKAGGKAKQYEETLNGRRYTVGEVRHVAIFPQETGVLKIDPLEMDVLANIEVRGQRGSNPFSDFFDDPFFDDFFNNSGFRSMQTVKKTLRSNSILIQVDPLPENAGTNFTGAVGTFSLKSSVDKDKLKANEAITYKMVFSGRGNLMHIDVPAVHFSPEFEVFEPKTTLNLQPSDGGISGTKTFEWVLIPKSKGNYTIPAAQYSYFDINQKKYVNLSTQEHTIVVEKGLPGSGYSSNNKQKVEVLNKDIDYIKSHAERWTPTRKTFFLSFGFWLTAILICLFSAVAIFVLWKLRESSKDVLSMRLKKAAKMAKKRLRKAEKFLQEQNIDAFYEETSQALWGYFSDKLRIEKSKLSIEEIQENLLKNSISENTLRQTIEMLNTCEYARFAPGKTTQGMNDFYKTCIETIVNIENELK